MYEEGGFIKAWGVGVGVIFLGFLLSLAMPGHLSTCMPYLESKCQPAPDVEPPRKDIALDVLDP